MGTDEIRLHAQKIPVPAAVVKKGFDTDFFLYQSGQGHRAHPGAGPGAVGDVDGIYAVHFHQISGGQGMGRIQSFGRIDLHADHKLVVKGPGQSAPFPEWNFGQV